MDLFHLFITFFSKGGPLMWPLFLVSVVAWFLGVEKWLFLRKFSGYRRKYLHTIKAVSSGKYTGETIGFEPYDFLLQSLVEQKKQGTCTNCYQSFREFLMATVPELDKGFTTMSAWISVAPLLGLLGTVSGMIQTFKVITDFGLGNPNLTAQGISIALITTQAGLTVAFPMMMLHNYLVNRSRFFISSLKSDGESLVTILRCPLE